jgi:predicted dithiol-disulfide oxidoreductase (DUF899 family)
MSTSRHEVRFPNETPAYRAARDALLESEMELRRRTEAVAAQRRALPLGGELREDYVFDDGDGAPHQVHLSELFAPGKDNLVLYSYMYGPQMANPCVACTSILDGLDGEAPHVSQHLNLAVVAKSPIERIRQVVKDRGWRHLRLLSSAHNTYNADYHGEDAKGSQLPALNVFTRRDGRIHHTYATELLFAPSEPGQDGRHVDSIWPLWNLFDMTPDGRPKWSPKLKY